MPNPKKMFQDWKTKYARQSFPIFFKGESFTDSTVAYERLLSLQMVKGRCVYLLSIKQADQEVFVYVGLTKSGVSKRWKQHLDSFYAQKKESYQHWKTTLFTNDTANHDTHLFVIKENEMDKSPIHFIPNPTISNVEKELINLLELIQPNMLLNNEGKSREQSYRVEVSSYQDEDSTEQQMITQQELSDWLASLPNHYFVPLFAQNDDGTVMITERISKSNGRQRLICRHSKMEEAIINIVREGLERDDWKGLIYIMGKGTLDNFQFLYVGKAESMGVKNTLSANIKGVDRGNNKHKFARWGDGFAYHIGDLSQAVFGNKGYQRAPSKYIRWAQVLFKETTNLTIDEPLEDTTLHLNERIQLFVTPWYAGSTSFSGLPSTIAAVEYDLIALGGQHFHEWILNTDGI